MGIFEFLHSSPFKICLNLNLMRRVRLLGRVRNEHKDIPALQSCVVYYVLILYHDTNVKRGCISPSVYLKYIFKIAKSPYLLITIVIVIRIRPHQYIHKITFEFMSNMGYFNNKFHNGQTRRASVEAAYIKALNGHQAQTYPAIQ